MRIQILILGFKGLKGRGHAICHPFKKFTKCVRINRIPKIMDQFCYLRPYLGTETVSCRLLQQNGHGLTLDKIGQCFRNVLMLCLMKFFFDILQLRLDFYFFRHLIFFIDTETLMLSVLSFYSGHLSYKNISLQCEQSGEVLCRRPFFSEF